MRKSIMMIAIVLAVAITIPAFAELQNVQVGGSIRIRGNWYSADNLAVVGGGLLVPLANDNAAYVEQRTRLNVKADFTDNVSAFVELDSYDWWGEEFRSNYITGVDGRAVTGDDVEVYQGYIEANEMFGMPLRARIGRQELVLGSEFLVGNNSTGAGFTGLSFDALRLTYAVDEFSVDAFWAKLVERSPLMEDGDVDLYGVYGSYLGIENITLDAYWLYIRDGALNNLDVHTFGLRGAGTVGALDFEAEGAYQIGNMDEEDGWLWCDEEGLESDSWGANAEVGYTLDMDLAPRFWLGAAYYEGADRDDNDWEWDHLRPRNWNLDWDDVNPVNWDWDHLAFWNWDFDSRTHDDLAFNRLFSDKEYSRFLDSMSNLTGFWTVRGGVSASPTESITLNLIACYLEATDDGVNNNDDNDIGYEVELNGVYNYTEDLSFEAGYAHLFADDDNADHCPLAWWVDDDDNNDDADYVYFETKLCF